MRTGRTTLTAILALFAALTIAVPATASIPQSSPELGSIGPDRAELLEPVELESDVIEPPCIAERHDLFGEPALEDRILVRASALQAGGRLSLHPALDRAFDIETSFAILPETHVWALEQIELFPRQGESLLSRALHQGYADLVGENAFAQTVLSPDPLGYLDSSNLYAFGAGDPVNNRDPRGEGVGDWLAEKYEAGASAIDEVAEMVIEGTDESQWFTRSAAQTMQLASGILRSGTQSGIELGEGISAWQVVQNRVYEGMPMEEARALIQDWDYLSAEDKARLISMGISKTAGVIAGARGFQQAIYKPTHTVRPPVDKSWKIKIHGKAQKTGTPGHRFRVYREAIREAKNPDVESVHLDHGYNRALDLYPKTVQPNRRPDVTSVYKDKTVERIEVLSKTDRPIDVLNRNTAVDPQLKSQGFKPKPPRIVKPTRDK